MAWGSMSKSIFSALIADADTVPVSSRTTARALSSRRPAARLSSLVFAVPMSSLSFPVLSDAVRSVFHVPV